MLFLKIAHGTMEYIVNLIRKQEIKELVKADVIKDCIRKESERLL